MSSVRLSGNASGTGVFTVASPNSNTDRTQTLPDATGTVVLDSATQSLTNKSFDSASVATVSGTAPLYMARAWVNFNGIGTVAIRASGNVTSITDNGTGDYTVNFTTAMPDANYAMNIASAQGGTGQLVGLDAGSSVPIQTTSSVRVALRAGTSPWSFTDCAYVAVSIFR